MNFNNTHARFLSNPYEMQKEQLNRQLEGILIQNKKAASSRLGVSQMSTIQHEEREQSTPKIQHRQLASTAQTLPSTLKKMLRNDQRKSTDRKSVFSLHDGQYIISHRNSVRVSPKRSESKRLNQTTSTADLALKLKGLDKQP